LLPYCYCALRISLKKRESKRPAASRYAYGGLDRVIHERARLSLLTSLITHGKGLSFGELKQFCALTDGNLNRHLQVLEEAKLVSVTKTIDQNRPQTSFRITATGRKRYLDYLTVLEQVLTDAASAVDGEPHRKGSAPDPLKA
jgi:predicted ArsR family transcriptional regulator